MESPEPSARFIIRQEERKDHGVLVSWEKREFDGAFVMRNATVNEGSVLVSRPAELDMKILSIICRENIRSVEDYAKWLAFNFKYKKHEDDDIWTPPDRMLDRRIWDCKDFALLNMAFLRVFNYRPRILAMARIADSHAICVFEKDGRYLWFDNNKLKVTPASSIDEFNRYISRHYRMAYMYEVNICEIESQAACAEMPAKI